MQSAERHSWHEVWSCDAAGRARMHGSAAGRTFLDACKQLACDSMDFWMHYDRGMYRGQRVCPSREEAEHAAAETG